MLNKIVLTLFLLAVCTVAYGVLRAGINAYDAALHVAPFAILYRSAQTF